MKKKIEILAVVAIVAGLAAAGLGVAHAATTNTANGLPSFMTNLVNAIAQKFNLNPSDVQQVVDAQKAAQKTALQEKFDQTFTDRINQAVAAGKLTQDQAGKILTEKKSVDAEIAALAGKTGTDLKKAMQQIRDSVKQWATDNKIPQQYLMFGFGERMGMGRGFSWGFGMGKMMGKNKPTTPSTSEN